MMALKPWPSAVHQKRNPIASSNWVRKPQTRAIRDIFHVGNIREILPKERCGFIVLKPHDPAIGVPEYFWP
jgi:hypothetical protein